MAVEQLLPAPSKERMKNVCFYVIWKMKSWGQHDQKSSAHGASRMLCLSGGKAAQTCLYLQKLPALMEKRGWPCFWCWRMLRPAWLINPKVKQVYSVKNSHSWQKLAQARMQQTELLIMEPASDSTDNLRKAAEMIHLTVNHFTVQKPRPSF